jgi:hypothetical protein
MDISATDLDSLKTAINFSQGLSQWSVLIIGGSVAALLGTANWRPRKTVIRCIYLLFVPALAFLFASAYYGILAQRNCLALMLLARVDANSARLELNSNLHAQLGTMQVGFSFLGIWFLLFLCWWIFDSTIDPEKKG